MQRRLFMRRLALTLFVAATFAALPACTNGYGGSSLGSGSDQPSQIAFANSSGSYVSFFKVASGSANPLAVRAVRTRAGIARSGASFAWSIRYGTSRDTYQLVDSATGLITYPSCPAVAPSANVAANALVVTSRASTIGVLPGALATPAATAPLGSGTAASPVYCLVLTATSSDGVSAPVTILVGN